MELQWVEVGAGSYLSLIPLFLGDHAACVHCWMNI